MKTIVCIHYRNETPFPFEITNQFTSVYSLKQLLKNELKKKYGQDVLNLIMSNNNKIMDDNRALYYYKLETGSDIYINRDIAKGGIPIEYILIACWIIALYLFIVLMISGLMPILSNAFYYLIQFSMTSVLNWFISMEQKVENVETKMETNLQTPPPTDNISGTSGASMQKQLADIVRKHFVEFETTQDATKGRHSGVFGSIRMFLDIGLFILQNFIVFVGIYTASALLIVPFILYMRGSTRCTALNIGHWVGITMALIYFVIYGLIFNGFDALVYGYSDVVEQLPDNILTAYLTPMIYGTKDAFDETKILSIPIIGEVLTSVDGMMIAMKELLDQADAFGCEGAKFEQFKKFIYHIAYVNADERQGILYNNQQIAEPKAGDFSRDILYREQIKNFKLETLTRMMASAFNDYQMNNDKVIYDEMCMFQKVFNFGWWNYLSKLVIQNITCGIFNVVDGLVRFIDNMGGALGVSNMIKSGVITGMGSTIAFIVILILSYFLSSMYGISF